MTAVLIDPSAPHQASPPISDYERLADLFSQIYFETHSISVTLELLDGRRAAGTSERIIDHDLPKRVLQIAASFFHVKAPCRLLRPGRHRDICAARWIASWLLRRQGWTTLKIGRFFSIDHSTVIHGLRRVRDDVALRRVAYAADALLVSRAECSAHGVNALDLDGETPSRTSED